MKQETTTLSAMKMLDQKGSLYQSEFTEKKAEVIDSKSLDCRRDKFMYKYVNLDLQRLCSCRRIC